MLDLVLIQQANPALRNPKMYFPLGLLYLASAVERAGFSVDIVDFRDGNMPIPESRFYGFSCTTPEVLDAKMIARSLKGITIIGGAHASLMPDDCMSHFDVTVVGEGEQILPDILRKPIGFWQEIEAEGNKVIEAPRIINLDNIAFPAWDKMQNIFSETLFPGEKYGLGEKASTIIGSRGCPFNCHYCANIHRTPVVYRSAANILAEVDELMKRGIQYFRFEDDNFTLIREFDELCHGLQERGVIYKCATRSDLITPEQADTMKASGCEECSLGVESADDYVLKLNNKRETSADHAKAIRILKNAGVRAKTYWMAGLPGETDKTLELNKQFLVDVKPNKWTLSVFTPYPGSEIFNSPGKFGIEIVDKDWSTWWNFREREKSFVHVLDGQTGEEMWHRFTKFYNFLKAEKWRVN